MSVTVPSPSTERSRRKYPPDAPAFPIVSVAACHCTSAFRTTLVPRLSTRQEHKETVATA